MTYSHEPSSADPWQSWVLSRSGADATQVQDAVPWTAPKIKIPGDIRMGIITLLILSPFAAATGIMFAASDQSRVTPAVSAPPPLVSQLPSVLPSTSPQEVAETTRMTRSHTPRTTTVRPQPEAPETILSSVAPPTSSAVQSSTAVSATSPSATNLCLLDVDCGESTEETDE